MGLEIKVVNIFLLFYFKNGINIEGYNMLECMKMI